jgi:ABC-type multidrug transport system fused ATPase/permease subunit
MAPQTGDEHGQATCRASSQDNGPQDGGAAATRRHEAGPIIIKTQFPAAAAVAACPLQPPPAATPPISSSDTEESRLSISTESEHFEIVWSNLSYRIEPKWYKKFNYIDRIFSHFAPDQTVDQHSSAISTASSSANMNDDQHQMHYAPPPSPLPAKAGGGLAASAGPPTAAPSLLLPAAASTTTPSAAAPPSSEANSTRSSLEPIEIFTNLNGTIKSGQMTAVLGPSGECFCRINLFAVVVRARRAIISSGPIG